MLKEGDYNAGEKQTEPGKESMDSDNGYLIVVAFSGILSLSETERFLDEIRGGYAETAGILF